MTDAAVTDEIEPDLVEQADADEPEEVVEDKGEEEASQEEIDEPSESSPEKEKDGFQERIDEITGKFRNAERQALVAEQQNRQLQEQLAAMQQQQPPTGPDKTLADFDYDEAAFAQYVHEQANNQALERAQQEQQARVQAQKQAEFSVKEQEFAKGVEDYMTVTRNPSVPITQPMVDIAQATDKGPEVLYYLGKNPDVAMQLARMDPLAMAYELGSIQATKLVKPEPPKADTPEPPPKIPAAKSSTKISTTDPASDKLSDAEWLKRENARLAKLGRSY